MDTIKVVVTIGGDGGWVCGWWVGVAVGDQERNWLSQSRPINTKFGTSQTTQVLILMPRCFQLFCSEVDSTFSSLSILLELFADGRSQKGGASCHSANEEEGRQGRSQFQLLLLLGFVLKYYIYISYILVRLNYRKIYELRAREKMYPWIKVFRN